MSAQSNDHTALAPTDVLDPVCGMTIAPDDAVGHVDYNGQSSVSVISNALRLRRAHL